MKGRPAVITVFGDLVKTSDLERDLTRLKTIPGSTATGVLRPFALIYFTSHKGTALAETKKDGID